MPGFAPIAIFAFNRPEHLVRCIDSLHRNPEASRSVAYLFLDGARNVEEASLVERVRTVARAATHFGRKRIIERESNWGLARNVIDGVTRVLAEHGRVIVVEDDLLVSPAFLSYMNQALALYQRSSAVFSVSGYNYPQRIMTVPRDYPYDAFFVARHMCWGWETWKDRWDKARWEIPDYDTFRASASWRRSFRQAGIDLPMMLEDCMSGNLNSWAIRWTYAHFVDHGVCLVPTQSFVNNMGVDGTGVHMAASQRYLHRLLNCKETHRFPPHVYIDPAIAHAYMMAERKSVFARVMLKAQKLIRRNGMVHSDQDMRGSPRRPASSLLAEREPALVPFQPRCR